MHVTLNQGERSMPPACRLLPRAGVRRRVSYKLRIGCLYTGRGVYRVRFVFLRREARSRYSFQCRDGHLSRDRRSQRRRRYCNTAGIAHTRRLVFCLSFKASKVIESAVRTRWHQSRPWSNSKAIGRTSSSQTVSHDRSNRSSAAKPPADGQSHRVGIDFYRAEVRAGQRRIAVDVHPTHVGVDEPRVIDGEVHASLRGQAEGRAERQFVAAESPGGFLIEEQRWSASRVK